MAAVRLLLPLLLLVLLSPPVLSLDLHAAAQRAASLFSISAGVSTGTSTGDSISGGTGGNGGISSSSAFEDENPMHVFRDASTGNLIESAEPAVAHATVTSLGETDKTAAAAAAAALARKLDELYLDDVAVRTRKVHIRGSSSSSSSGSGVAAALFFGRKGGMSSAAAGAAAASASSDDSAPAVKAVASSSSSAASAGVSASSSAIPSSHSSSRAQTRTSKRSRLLSFN